MLATDSSTLEATAKFRDTLTGRKETVWLTPMIAADLTAFRRTFGDFEVEFLSLEEAVRRLSREPLAG